MFLADGANSVLLNMGFAFYRVSIFVRLLVQIYFLSLLLRTRGGRQVWWLMLFFYLVFLAGSMAALISLYSTEEYDFLGNFRAVNKVIFFFICYEMIKQYFRAADERGRLFRVYEILILTQAVVIIVSFVFDIAVFRAYGGVDAPTKRFGYQGLIPAQNEISAFFLGAFFFFLLKVVYLRRGIFELLITTVAALFTGTKVTLVLPVILILYLLSYTVGQFLKGRSRFRKVYLVIGIVFLSFLVIAVWQQDYLLSRIAPTISYYTYQAGHHDPSGTLLSALMSPRRRQGIAEFFSEYLPRFNLLNYLFGGFNLVDWATETDPVDIFALLGLVGGAAFYYFYLRALIPAWTICPTRLVFVLTWLGVSTVAGHIAYTAINGTYLAILLLYFSSLECQEQVQVECQVDKEVPKLGLA